MKISAADGTFLRSSAWRALPAVNRVARYFDALGVTEVNSQEARQKQTARLAKRHPHDWKHLEAVIHQRGEGDFSGDLYAAKNVNLDLSLGAGALHAGIVHRVFLTHFAPKLPTPPTILDIGCENGLLACYYALLYPEADVAGFDPCAGAVGCATELCTLLGIRNAKFYTAALRDVAAMATGRTFQLIVGTTVFQDSGFIPDHSGEGAPAGFVSPHVIGPLNEVRALRQIVAASGEWISLERCRCSTDLAWWLQTVAASGWAIDWPRSQKIACTAGAEANDLNLTVFLPANGSSPIDHEEIRALWLSARFTRAAEFPGAGAWAFRDEAARACREIIQPKQMQRNARADGAGSWESLQVWTAGPFAMFYAENPEDAAFLRWGVRTQLAALTAEWQQAVDELRGRVGPYRVVLGESAVVKQPPSPPTSEGTRADVGR